MAENSNSGTEQVVLNINVTGTEQVQQANQEVQKLGQTIETTGKKDVGTEQFKNYRQLIREATFELQKVEQQSGKNSAAFLSGAKNLAELKRRAQEFNDTIKAFSPEDKFKAFSKIAQGATGTLAGVSGAMVALGFESDKSAQVMARLQGLLLFSNALNQLDDIKQGFLDFGRVIKSLFVIKQADTAVTEAQRTANEAALATQTALTTATAERATAEIALGEATAAANQLVADTESALLEVRAAGIDSEVELNVLEANYLELAAAKATALAELTALQEAYNSALLAQTEAQTAATAASEAQTVATAAVAAAEGAATIGAVTLKLALWSIGIGLLISLVAAVVAQWDNLKSGFLNLFPVLKDSKNFFNEFMQVITGVGNVVLHFLLNPINETIQGIKILKDVIRGDFKAALGDFKKIFTDITDAYGQGVAIKAAQQAAEVAKIRLAKEIEANERIIKERKALGQDTTALEVQNQKLKISQLDKDDKDYQKKKLDLESEITVLLNTEQKKRADAAAKIKKEAAEKEAAALKSDLDKIQKANQDALKVIAEGSQHERDRELTDIKVKYDKEQALLEKRKADVADYNKDYNNLVEARKDEEARINKKYDDQINDYLKSVSGDAVSVYDKNIDEINKKIDEFEKTASPALKEELESSRSTQINKQRTLKIANAASVQANTVLTKVKDDNRSSLADTPQEAKEKINNVTKAEIDAENAAYNLKKEQLAGQNDELQQLEADHQSKLTDINKSNSEARQAIAKAEKDNHLQLYDAIGQAADTASNIIGQNTIAGKALAIASATISTYSAIAKTLEAYSTVPIPGFAIAQSIAIGLAGLANVKKIIDVQVPATAGTNTNGAGASIAPVINSTVLQQANNGTQDVVNAVNQNTNTQKDIRAFIVDKDLDKQKTKSKFFDNLSSY